MMAKQALHDILCGVLEAPFPDGKNHCYFEPPDKLMMVYPCIRYSHVNDQDRYADNKHYTSSKRYTVTIIDRNPDSIYPERMKEIPYCSLDRVYSADGLSHFIYTLYYNGPRFKEVNTYVETEMG